MPATPSVSPPTLSTPVPGSPDPLIFDVEAHGYHHSGRKLTGVSKLLSYFKRPFDSDYWSKYKADQLNVSQQEILDQWAAKRDASCDLGHLVHEYAESLVGHFVMGSESPAACLAECQTPAEFLDSVCSTCDQYRPYREAAEPFCHGVLSAYRDLQIDPIEAEKQVCCPRLGLAGTVDLTCYTTDYGRAWPTILDWKTNAEIKLSNAYGDTMLPPLSHLDCCNFYHYALQLNVYRLLLARRYAFHADRMVLVWLTGDREEIQPSCQSAGYQLIEIPDLQTEVSLMLSAWQRMQRDGGLF